MKICTKCKIEKELTEFANRSDSKDGKRADCKVCRAKTEKNYRQKNEKKLKVKRDNYRKANKDKINAKKRLHHNANKKRLNEISRQWRINNLETKKQIDRDYYQKNKDTRKKYYKIYRDLNKDKLLFKQREYESQRRKNDVSFRITKSLRSRLRIALIMQSTIKAESTFKLIGSSVAYVRKYLEAQFVDGMSWENYGEWHIDHIRPCASFDLTDPDQQKECFNYKNLQPLWAEDNLRKSDRWI